MTGAVWVIYGLLLSYFVALNLLHIGFLIAGLWANRLRAMQGTYTDFERLEFSGATIPISVIIPAFNEQTVIRESVLSFLGSRYPEFEVIVVNDGSTDATLAVLNEQFDLYRADTFGPTPIATKPVHAVYRARRAVNLTVIDKENGGEADAVNAGVNRARYRYILHTDADCVCEPATLLRTIREVNFDPRRVIALGGQLRASNGLVIRDGAIVDRRLPRRLVERFQTIEYMSVFLTHRLAWSSINGVPVVAGGFSAWRRDVVIELGGYATDVTHEDIELAVHAHEHFRRNRVPYQLAMSPDAVIWTQVPPTWGDLMLQRKRWQRVMFEVVWKYRRMIFNPRYGVAGLITMPYLLLYEAIGPFVEIFAYVFAVVLALLGVLDFQALLLFLALSFLLTAATRLVSLLTDVLFFGTYDTVDVAKLAVLAIVEPLIYRPALLPARAYAFVEFLRGRKTHEQLGRVAVSSDAGATVVGRTIG
jgi:cellulose synthase/poly-beta-1,6-N-acetylglucosamine synthase-like glycosyltransferase